MRILWEGIRRPTRRHLSPSEHFPELLNYKRRTSRMFEARDGKNYFDDWWFQFDVPKVDGNDFIVLAGAMGIKRSTTQDQTGNRSPDQLSPWKN
jgi:hypothetical protein